LFAREDSELIPKSKIANIGEIQWV
jgi:hypothetical protein